MTTQTHKPTQKQIKSELFAQINKLANEFSGADEVYGVKGWDVERLRALRDRYATMMQYERIYRKVFNEHYTSYQEFQMHCLMENPPEWFKRMWACHMVAIGLWRGQTLEEMLEKNPEASLEA